MNAPVLIDRPTRWTITTDDFWRIRDSGALDDWGKVELLDGEIFVMNAQYMPHARAQARLVRELSEILPAGLEVVVELAVMLSDSSAPQPDLVVTSYEGRGSVPLDTVALVVEVSYSTRAADLGRKVALYGAAGIPEYWVVDVEREEFFVHSEPMDDGYAVRAHGRFGDPLVFATLDGVRVDTGALR